MAQRIRSFLAASLAILLLSPIAAQPVDPDVRLLDWKDEDLDVLGDREKYSLIDTLPGGTKTEGLEVKDPSGSRELSQEEIEEILKEFLRKKKEAEEIRPPEEAPGRQGNDVLLIGCLAGLLVAIAGLIVTIVAMRRSSRRYRVPQDP
jgi:hypothetical protein